MTKYSKSEPDSENHMHVLIYTSQCRLPGETFAAPFTTYLLSNLRGLADVTLACPIPWAPDLDFVRNRPQWKLYVGVPDRAELDGQEIFYLKFPFIPRIGGAIQAVLQLFASYRFVRKLHSLNQVDVINGRFIYPDGVTAMWIGRRLGIPVVLTALGSDINVDAQSALRRWQIRWALRHADHVTVVSEELAKRVVELGAPIDRVSCSPNGVDLDRFTPGGTRPEHLPRLRPGQEGRLVVVSRLVQGKGMDVLLEALSLLQRRGLLRFQTIVIGDGPERQRLEDMARMLEVSESIIFTGAVLHDDVPSWLRSATVFCLPSLREGTPNVVLEALASGVPVVATNVGGIPDVVDARNGLLVPPGDSLALAEAISAALEKSWDAVSIRDTVKHMSWQEEARWHWDIFNRAVMAQHRGRHRSQCSRTTDDREAR